MGKSWSKDMSSKFVFKLNWPGLKELMRSEEMRSVLKEYATSVKDYAGEGYEVVEYMGKSRRNTMVHARTKKAFKDNLENNTLLKALGSVKD